MEEHHRRRHTGHRLLSPANQAAGAHHGAHPVLHTQSLCLPATADRDRPAEKGTDRHQVRRPDAQFGTDGTQPSVAHRGVRGQQGKRLADLDHAALPHQVSETGVTIKEQKQKTTKTTPPAPLPARQRSKDWHRENGLLTENRNKHYGREQEKHNDPLFLCGARHEPQGLS